MHERDVGWQARWELSGRSEVGLGYIGYGWLSVLDKGGPLKIEDCSG